MASVIEAPLEMVESAAALRFPPRTGRRLQLLMDRNTEGTLTPDEREELTALVELSEKMTLVRSQAMRVLGRDPGCPRHEARHVTAQPTPSSPSLNWQ